jgi:hypothetical protein
MFVVSFFIYKLVIHYSIIPYRDLPFKQPISVKLYIIVAIE